MQIITLGARHAQCIALNTRLNFDLTVFDYALNLFSRNESERIHELKESALKRSVTREVDAPRIIEERTTSSQREDVQMNPYLKELSKY